ncbi:MAG: ABC transporter substrate-binding protein [Syntrophaceae bacterium]|nr:ABC transporter substrate-binding protein [Syntrophaceae bacterium]
MALCSARTYAQGSYLQRIISLSPSVTEEMYILGVEDKLVGCTVYCQKPPEAEKKEKVGTVMEVNLEKVVSLRPELVLTTSLVKRETKEKLKNLGIKVITFPAAKTFEQMCEQLLELGRIVGKEERAKELIVEAKDKTDAIRRKVRGLPKPKVFAQIGAKPLFAATKDYFVNDFIEFAGGTNIARDLNSGLYSREKVLEANPDVILIVTMGIVGEQEKKIWEKYDVIKAVRTKRIYILDSNELCSPTPVSFADTLEKVVEILHP